MSDAQTTKRPRGTRWCSTGIVAASLVQAGLHERVLTVCYEKQSESNAMWALSNPQPFSTHLNAGAGGYFAPIIREYMRRSSAPYDVGIKVAVKDRLHGARNPLAHLQKPDITMAQAPSLDGQVSRYRIGSQSIGELSIISKLTSGSLRWA